MTDMVERGIRDANFARGVQIAARILRHAELESRTGVEFVRYVPASPLSSDPIAAQRTADEINQTFGFRARMHAILGGLCGICGLPIDAVHDVTFDHVVPRCRGGLNSANMVPAHSTCNGAKADRMPTGCELIMLAIVNAHLGYSRQGRYSIGPQKATLAHAFASLSPLPARQVKG